MKEAAMPFDDFYRAMHGKVTAVVTDSEVAPVVADSAHVRHSEHHANHSGESLARQRKAKLAGSAAAEPERLAKAVAAFVQLDHQKRDSTFYVGHVGLK